MFDTAGFKLDVVAARLLEKAYSLIAALPVLAVALLVIWVGWLIGRWLSRRALLDRVANRNPFLRDLARTTVRWAVMLAAVLVALEVLDATALVGAVLGTAGVLGVALGFAFKETLENYLAGILMSLRQPFSPSDHVVIDGNEGIVVALTSRATILMTLDGNHLRLPNALVFKSVTLNYTRNPSRRFHFDVGIGVNEDLVLAQRIGVTKLQSMDGIAQSPPPRSYIAALGDSNVQVRFHGWVDQRSHDFLLTKSEAIRQVKLALEEAQMDIPEPIYRVQITERAAAADAVRIDPGETARLVSEKELIDTRVNSDLEDQIARDRDAHGSRDLLDRAAPKE